MRVLRRSTVLAGSLGLVATSALALAPTTARAAQPSGSATVPVHGRLLVVPSERPGGHPSYGVALADGDIVPVRGSFDPSVRTGAMFHGRLALPASVTGALARRGAVADKRSAALRLVDQRALTLPVVGTPSVEAAVAPQLTGTVHRQFVAAIDNKGALGQSDAALLGHVSKVGGYWQDESNGAISGMVVPATVKHYNTAVATTDCGLGDDFFSLVEEAEAKFPGIDPFAGTDQLVVFVPPACQAGTTVGEGTVGSSFANGGALIVKAGNTNAIDGTYAHETGHNYGFQHANARTAGTSLEYFGIYDVMGFALNSPVNQLNTLSTAYRVFQGITDPGEVQDISLGDETQPVHVTATIKPRTDATGVRSLSVIDPDTGEQLYLDDRAGTGKDAGSAYALNGALDTGNGLLVFNRGVVISTPRGAGGLDDFSIDATGHMALIANRTWTNGSGTLSIHVVSADSSGAVVDVDFTPPTQDFTTVGNPVIGGDVAVGGAVTLDLGAWSPTPTRTKIRWTADGMPVANTDDKASFVPAAALEGKSLVATVTVAAPGVRATTTASAAVTVSTGTIPLTAAPSITGAARVGAVLHGHTATLGTMVSAVTGTWQWRADGVDIPGATGPDYTVKVGDLGKAITVVEQLTAPSYQPVTTQSLPTAAVALGVLTTAKPTVSGKPVVGRTLTAKPGSWTAGTRFGYAWFADGVRIKRQTAKRLVLAKAQRGKRITVTVTGSKPGYTAASRTSFRTTRVT